MLIIQSGEERTKYFSETKWLKSLISLNENGRDENKTWGGRREFSVVRNVGEMKEKLS